MIKKKIMFALLLVFLLNSSLYCIKNLYIKNKCYKTIWICAIVKDYEGDWVHLGWYKLNPYGEEDSSVFLGSVKTSYFYIYALLEDGSHFLKGGSKKRFKGKKKYPFKSVQAKKRKQGWRVIWTYSLKCK
jgi:hypothetical protein